MDWFKRLRKERGVREVALLCISALFLLGAAVVLTVPSLSFVAATPLGVSQGQADYNGGYPSPLSCYINTTLCRNNAVRMGTLSVRAFGSSVGQTANIDENKTHTTIGTPVVVDSSDPLTIEWACQPYQTVSQTCYYYYGCNYSWWDEGHTCSQAYECGPGTIELAKYSTSTGFFTGGAMIGTTTVQFPSSGSSYTYELSCAKNGGPSYVASVTVTRGSDTPAATLTANPTTVNSGSSSLLSWTSTEPAGQCSLTPSTTAQTVIYLTSGTSWTVPANWNSTNNSIEVIGGGGGGRSAVSSGGGGGGGYSKTTNLTLTPGASVTYQVGSGGAAGATGGDTFFNRTSGTATTCNASTMSVCAKGGAGATSATGGAGGALASGVGSTKYSGGSGGNGGSGGGGGGGGAAGPNGSGARGGTAATAGGGGGGNGGGFAGANAVTTASGKGGNSYLISGGGQTGGYSGGNGTNVAALNGGGGFGGTTLNALMASVSTFLAGGAGSRGIEWDSTRGSGGGGGGGASGGAGGSGSVYGGGGGAGSTGGTGGAGIIVITYTP